MLKLCANNIKITKMSLNNENETINNMIERIHKIISPLKDSSQRLQHTPLCLHECYKKLIGCIINFRFNRLNFNQDEQNI